MVRTLWNKQRKILCQTDYETLFSNTQNSDEFDLTFRSPGLTEFNEFKSEPDIESIPNKKYRWATNIYTSWDKGWSG